MSDGYSAPNHFSDGGKMLEIGGELVIKKGAKVTDEEGALKPHNPIPYIAPTTATNVAGLRETLNALLKAMQASGLMEDGES